MEIARYGALGMLKRSNSASEAGQTIFITFAKQLKVIKHFLVKVWLSKEAVKRFIRSTVRSVRTSGAIILGGVWNAYLLSGDKSPPDTIVLGHVARGGDTDLMQFAARLASIVDEPTGDRTRYFDVLLRAEDATSIGEYLTTARFFNKQINLHVATDIKTYRSMVPTIAVPSLIEELRDFDGEPVFGTNFTAIAKGNLRVPTFYGGLAREFLKTVDARKKYCVICAAAEWPPQTIQDIACSFAETHPIWRFILMEVNVPTTWVPTATANIIWPAGAGLEFGTRMALVVEADALIGPSCLLALIAALAERPVTVLASGESALKLSPDLGNVRAVHNFKFSNLQSEIKSLIDRVDEQEFQF